MRMVGTTRGIEMSITIAVLAAFSQIGGCPTGTMDTTDATTGDDQTLTSAEQAAMTSALTGVEAISNAANASQASTAAGDDQQSGQSAGTGPGTIEFGTCPVVTASSSNILTGSGQFSLTLDFGDGCDLGDPNYVVSGTASGSLDRADNSLSVDFNTLSLTHGGTSASLDGTLDGTYARDLNSVQVDGQWDLSYESGNGTTSTDGTGTVIYDRNDQATTIESFDGTISNGQTSYNVEADGLIISFYDNGNFIPSAGTLTISGSDIRTLAITFNADSPQTGEVTISINGGPAFSFNLGDLGELLAEFAGA